MARYLVTHSLLSSWLYALKDNPYESMADETDESDATKRDSFADFMLTLNRKPIESTEAMRRGIEFENLVTAITEGRGDREHRWYDAAAKVAGIVKGGLLQYKARREITVKGMTLVLYGRLDTLKSGVIYDIKFSGSYDVGKYIDSTQHPTYFELVPEAPTFTYLVSNGSAVWTETYRRDETPGIIPVIEDFLDWLTLQGLMGTFKEKWLAL